MNGTEETNTLLPLVIIALLAFIVPFVAARFRRVRIPNVVAEILAGMAVGGIGLNLVRETESLTFLAEFGFAYLMFLSGLEIDFGMLRRRTTDPQLPPQDERVSIGPSIGAFAITLGLSFLVSYGLYTMGLVRSAPMMTLILSTTSLGIVTPVLKERGLLAVPFGQRVLITALVADFGTMVLISILAAVLSGGNSAEVLLILALFAAFFLVYRTADQLLRWNLRLVKELEHATSQIGVRGSFVLILLFVALALSVGSEMILGAFLAGAIVSLISERQGLKLQSKLDAIGYGFFIPIFFIMVGVRFDGSAILQEPTALILIPVLLVVLYVVKMAPMFLFRRVHSARENVAAGLLLSARLSLIIAASEIGLSLGVIAPSINAAVVLLAIITSVLSPVLFSRIAPEAPQPDSRNDVYILGANRRSLQLGHRLREHGYDVCFIDVDEDRLAMVGESDFRREAVDATDVEALRSIGVDGAVALVATAHKEQLNLEVVQTLRRAQLRIGTVISMAESRDVMNELRELDVKVVSPALATLLILENLVVHPDIFTALGIGEDEEGGEGVSRRLVDVTIENPRIREVTLGSLELPPGVLVLSIKRGANTYIPRGQTMLRSKDRLTIMGEAAQVDEVVKLLSSG